MHLHGFITHLILLKIYLSIFIVCLDIITTREHFLVAALTDRRFCTCNPLYFVYITYVPYSSLRTKCNIDRYLYCKLDPIYKVAKNVHRFKSSYSHTINPNIHQTTNTI